jgi:hypothetical protein
VPRAKVLGAAFSAGCRVQCAAPAWRDKHADHRHSVEQHFAKRDPGAQSTYAALLKAAEGLGPVRQDAKKTSIHLVRRTAFAGVTTRRSCLVLTLKSPSDIKSPRILKHEQASAGRWYLEVRLESPDQVDGEIRNWLRKGYEISG